MKATYDYTEALELCLSEMKQTHQFFFDSADVVNIIQGRDAYFDRYGKFNSAEFESLRTLVISLAWGGVLSNQSTSVNTIYMTPTHQAEIFRLLQNDFGIYHSKEATSEQYIKQFVDEVGHLEELSFRDEDPVNRLTHLIDKGKHGFKIIQSLSPLVWNQRFKDFRDSRTKKFEVVDYNYRDFKVGDDDYFQDYLTVVKELKKGKHEINAFSDALALAYLARLVKKFNNSSDETVPIPIFFDSSDFKSALEKYGLIEPFIIKLANGTTQCILRNAKFFLAYSVANFGRQIISYHNQGDELVKAVLENTNTMASFRDRLANKNMITTLKSDYFDKLEQEIETYLTFEFCKKRLVPFFAEESLGQISDYVRQNDSIKILIDELKKLDQDQLNSQSKKQQNELAAYLSKIKTWDVIEQKIKQFEELNNTLEDGLDVFNDFGLVRFFIPDAYHKGIVSFLDNKNGIFSADDRISFLKSQKIYDYYVEFSSDECNPLLNSEQTENLYILLCVFWALGFYEEIYSKILNDKLHFSVIGPDHPLLMIKAAALFKGGNPQNREALLNKIISRLEKKFNSGEHQQTKYEVAVMLAYIYFNSYPDGNRFSATATSVQVADQPLYAKKAIYYAHQACEYYKNTRVELLSARLYATNILIYYIVEVGTDDEINKILETFKQFAALEVNAGTSWHFRYDDTVARYYYRQSKQNSNYSIEKRKGFLKQSKEKVNYALSRWEKVSPNILRKISGCRDVQDIKNFRDITIALDPLDS
ncbi:hypothetical protein [Spirosoma koreense]